MNWFKNIKISQIWRTNPIGESEFANNLSDLYELEYKYSIITTRKFNGTEARKNNIIDRLKQELKLRINKILPFLRVVFRDWLTTHALLDPKKWAKGRIKQYKEHGQDEQGGPILEVLTEADMFGIDIIRKINDNMDSFPSIKQYLELAFQEYRDSLQEDIKSGHLTEEGVSEMSGSFDLFEYLDMFGNSGNKGLAEMLNSGVKNGYLDEDKILLEIVPLIFEGWYAKWSAEGIDETRKNIVKVYNMLNNIKGKSFNEILAIINMAINVAHQTGPMLDYIQEKVDDIDLDRVLLSLSHGDNIEQWNEELRKIGVGI